MQFQTFPEIYLAYHHKFLRCHNQTNRSTRKLEQKGGITMASGEQKKRTMEALERRFAQAQAEHNILHQPKSKKPTLTTTTPNSSPSLNKSIVTSSAKKGNLSFSGYTSAQDVELNNPAYLQLSHLVDENLLKITTENCGKNMTVNNILHDLLQHGDSAQKYMQGSKNVKVDNWILLDNVVQKSNAATRARSRALQRQSKRSKRHMSLKQHKKFGSFDLPQDFHDYNIFKPMQDKWKDYVTKLLKNIGKNQLSQCLLNADLHGALILVVHCKVAGLIGVHGVMIRETVETFGIITEDNKFQVVPKKLSVFMLQVDCWKVTLLGDKLISRNMLT